MPYKFNPFTDKLDLVETLQGAPFVATLTGNDSVAVPASAGGNINTVGSGNITTTGNAGTNTETISLTGITQHAVQIGGASNTLTQSSIGATGTVLAGNTGADPTFQTASSLGSSLVLIQSQTASSSSNLSFTTGITSAYSTYFFVLTNVLSSNSGVGLNLQLSTDGGVTYLSTGYLKGITRNPYNSVLTTNANTTTQMIGFSNEDASTLSVSATVYLYGLTGTSNKMATANGTTFGTTTLDMIYSCGIQTTASAINAMQWKFNAGTIASGTISLFGIRES